MFGFFMLKTVYFTIYTYMHQLFAMFSGRLQHLPEENKKLMQVSQKQAFYLKKHTVFDIYVL